MPHKRGLSNSSTLTVVGRKRSKIPFNPATLIQPPVHVYTDLPLTESSSSYYITQQSSITKDVEAYLKTFQSNITKSACCRIVVLSFIDEIMKFRQSEQPKSSLSLMVMSMQIECNIDGRKTTITPDCDMVSRFQLRTNNTSIGGKLNEEVIHFPLEQKEDVEVNECSISFPLELVYKSYRSPSGYVVTVYLSKFAKTAVDKDIESSTGNQDIELDATEQNPDLEASCRSPQVLNDDLRLTLIGMEPGWSARVQIEIPTCLST